jgi:Flp pilus assembly protein TadD
LTQAVKEAPGMPLVHFVLAKAYRDKAQKAEAIRAAQKCVEIDPNFADAHYLLGQLYLETGQPDLARREMELFQAAKRKEP